MAVHLGAMALAAAMVGIGVLSLLTASRHSLLVAWLGSDTDHGRYAASRKALRGQGYVLFISAAVTALVAGGPAMGLTGEFAMMLVAVLVAVQAVMIWLLYGNRDPFIRQILGETASGAFWVAIVGLFLWAAAERFVGVPRLEALDLVVAAMAVHGVTVMRVIVRRLRR